ncbi:MAG: hypothetical protein ABIY63_06745 [Fibrobacteria bacterium]
MHRILIPSLLLDANLSAEPSISNEGRFDCLESLSTGQFLTGLGVGTLTFVGGIVAGELVAEKIFPDNLGGFILVTGLTGSFAGGFGIFGTWKLFCEGNRKNHVTFRFSPNTVASQWEFNF